jgi:hypothetical protein
MIQAVGKVVHEDMKPEDALQVYEDLAQGARLSER